ncbi:hypothetical protein PPYR_08669 [Photinus pyralis]|uniref:Uncharacterized protein n=1 Tax=Photinus pyralis TaxID=7054 RepID=A0A5N4AK47_PHOPY|nr:hypothetical protein PPYR_08669 [Photinus pyralis]
MEEKSYPTPYSTGPTTPLDFDQQQQIPSYPVNQGLQQPPSQYDNHKQPPPLNPYNTAPTVPVPYVAQPQPTVAALNSTLRAHRPRRIFGIRKRKDLYIVLGVVAS